jgi:cyclic pyranopterin phosphate synthase
MMSCYLRLSVTDRCGFRCRYCRPEASASSNPLPASELIELVERIDEVSAIRKLRLTGGEPLLRPDLLQLVERLRTSLPEATIGVTTNGRQLTKLALPLRRAGVSAINVSLDAADPERFAHLTGGRLTDVLAGLAAVQQAGFSAVKLNAVLLRSYNGGALADIVRIATRFQLSQVRFIELMPLGAGRAIFEREYLPAAEALERLSAELTYLGPRRSDASATARLHRFGVGDDEVTVGLIAPVSAPFCHGCDRLRLDSQGRLYRCLRQQHGLALAGLPPADASAAIRSIVAAKERRRRPDALWPCRDMIAIGG